ncbi:MAG: TolC family protein [Bacteroidota bacterium]|nr:TolC family protein [Bacteroidota bacterium]
MKNYILFVYLFSISINLLNAQEKWSLNKCIQYAWENNIEIQSGYNALANANLSQWQSKLAFLPTANINGGYYWNFGLTIDPITNTRKPGSRQTLGTTASINWTLLSGGRNIYQLQQTTLNQVAALYQLEEIKNNTFLNIASAYLQIIVNIQLESVAQGQLSSSVKSLERTKILYENGAISEDNYLQSVAQTKVDEGNLTSAVNAVQLSKLQLFQILQLETDFESFDIEVPEVNLNQLSIIDYDRDDLKNQAVQNQPAVRAAQANLESARYGIKLANSARYPSLFFLAQLNSNYVQGLPYFTEFTELTTYTLVEDPLTGNIEQIPQVINVPDPNSQTKYTLGNQLSDNWNQFIGFGFQVPLFNGGTTHAGVQRAKIQENNASLDRKASELAVRQTIERALLDAKNSLALFNAANASAQASELALNNAQLNFDEGVISAFDLGLSKNQYLAAKSQEIQTKFDYLFKVKVLEFYLFNQISL